MSKELKEVIEQLSLEKGLPQETIIEIVESTIREAAQKYFNKEEILNVIFDINEGEVKILTKKKVVGKVNDSMKEISWESARKHKPDVKIGEEIEIPIPPEILGRTVAYAFKNLIFNKITKVERERIYKEYFPRIDEVVTGRVRRFLGEDAVLMLDKAEALLPKKEQLPNETLKRDKELKVMIKKVYREGKDPQIIVTRLTEKFLVKLLKQEIPELDDGTIELKNVVREPGIKSKVAVYTEDKAIDPVGACIGMRGNRILAITRELNGERIDVVVWSEDPEIFIKNAMSPAKVIKVKIVDKEKRRAYVYVTKDQLAIAIGKQGVNVKLASRLTKWHIDLQVEE